MIWGTEVFYVSIRRFFEKGKALVMVFHTLLKYFHLLIETSKKTQRRILYKLNDIS